MDIFGGSKQSSNNSNKDLINSTFSPVAKYAQQGGDAIGKLLGGDSTGFDNYKKAVGYDATAEMGSRGITGNAAAGGLLRSGSTGKALQNYSANLANQYSGNYLDKLLGMAGLGTNAGQLIAGAGSQSSGKSKEGIGKFLGTIASGAAASDRRLKKNIHKIGELKNGLGVYRYDYKSGKGPYVGVMADEVQKIMPEALGETIAGYMTVDYGKIDMGAYA